MDINIRNTVGTTGKLRIQGDTVYQDTKFTFSLCKSCIKPYSYVLKLSIISPADNRILQVSGRRLKDYRAKLEKDITALQEEIAVLSEEEHCLELLAKKQRLEDKLKIINDGGRLDDLNAQRESYLMTDTPREIKNKVREVVPQLYGEYQHDILAALKLSVTPENLHARTALDMYQSDFFQTQNKVLKETLESKLSTLKTVCNAINHKAIGDLDIKDIARASKQIGKNPNQKLHLCESFLDFCGQNHLYRGANPITLYFQSIGVKKGGSKKKAGIYPSQQSFLSPNVEMKLHELVNETIADDLSLAIPLVKGCRMSMDRLLTITWGELEFEGDQIRIQEYKDNFTGATLNYIHPPLGEVTQFLLKKFVLLQEKVGLRKLKKMRLVPITGTTKEQKNTLTKYFRDMLRRAGVNENEFKRASDVNNPKAAGGAGYALLCKHHDYVLQHRCGVTLNSGVGAYLRGMRIYDITTDSYQSLSDTTGNHFLQTIVLRDQFFFYDDDVAPTIDVENDEGISTVSINPGNSPHLMGAISKPIFLPTGSKLVIEGDSGVMGTVSFSASKTKRAGGEYIKIF